MINLLIKHIKVKMDHFYKNDQYININQSLEKLVSVKNFLNMVFNEKRNSILLDNEQDRATNY